MSQFTDYLLGQMQHKLHSIESAQVETNEKLDTLTERVDEALSWAQRLVLLGLSILGAIGLNLSPDKAGETVANILKALR